MKIVVAVDKFKGSLSAADVAHHLRIGMTGAAPGAAAPKVVEAAEVIEVVEVPIADGGDGTVDAALAAGYRSSPVEVDGPTGAPVSTYIATLPDRAVVELASTCGLQLLPGGVPAPMTASSRGVGQAIRAAVEMGARDIVIGVGGSASTDGGAGLLQALGAQLTDASGAAIGPGATALAGLRGADLTPARDLLAGIALTLASDVANPLLGADGAAAVYGPQKGATAEQVLELDALLGGFVDVLATADAGARDVAARPGAGAAGGAGYAALLLGASFRPGIEVVLDLVGLDDHLSDADLVVTGEGSLDAQSLQGKAPVGVAAAAARHGVPVVAVAGRVTLTETELTGAGISRAYPLSDLAPDTATSIRDAGALLESIGARIGGDLDTLLRPRTSEAR
ncbi:glycerate kinase [Flexivirga sp. ID2601S]|uniref:Glycerate kinase n=1 Tax=Flexivirga aerilata TaxID=1656889 RepID=A0A849AV61_9MICO|nr:glycerate kinase [Flexivirga aerilata]NNG40572.1 glycerate kinase [Flexivirga aerilata]